MKSTYTPVMVKLLPMYIKAELRWMIENVDPNNMSLDEAKDLFDVASALVVNCRDLVDELTKAEEGDQE